MTMQSKQVTLSDYYICDHEVTQSEYVAIIGSISSDTSKYIGNTYLVNKVCWYNAIVFFYKLSMAKGLEPCYTINNSTGGVIWGSVPKSQNPTGDTINCNFSVNGFLIPTEAEWGYAARGGIKTKGYTYSDTNTIGDVANYSINSNSNIKQVKSKNANELDLYDITGNLWEFYWDWYNESSAFENGASLINSKDPDQGSYRVGRGMLGIVMPLLLHVFDVLTTSQQILIALLASVLLAPPLKFDIVCKPKGNDA